MGLSIPSPGGAGRERRQSTRRELQGSEENLGFCLLWGIRGWEPTLGGSDGAGDGAVPAPGEDTQLQPSLKPSPHLPARTWIWEQQAGVSQHKVGMEALKPNLPFPAAAGDGAEPWECWAGPRAGAPRSSRAKAPPQLPVFHPSLSPWLFLPKHITCQARLKQNKPSCHGYPEQEGC